MALRVLLADESSTIKKVMQLALQDFAIEVKSVPIGLDVVAVARSFQPDIAFVDVLLQKRSGYDVVIDLRREMPKLPCVLMWSGFMELDEAKAATCGAQRRLEKPFDADDLRSLIKELVPRTRENVISDYLTFPPLPDFDEPAVNLEAGTPPSGVAPAQSSATLSASQPIELPLEAPVENSGSLGGDIYGIPEVDENTEILTKIPNENWSHQDLAKFQVPLGDDAQVDDFAIAQVRADGEFEEVTFAATGFSRPAAPTGPGLPATGAAAPRAATPPPVPPSTRATATPAPPPRPSASSAPGAGPTRAATPPPPTPSSPAPAATASAPRTALSEVTAERILREEARQIIEKLAWQILPEITERIVKEELNKLLKSAEQDISGG